MLRGVADAHGATPAQIALAWVIRSPAVTAIPGASSVEQLESNVAAADIELSDDEDRPCGRRRTASSRSPAGRPSPACSGPGSAADRPADWPAELASRIAAERPRSAGLSPGR